MQAAQRSQALQKKNVEMDRVVRPFASGGGAGAAASRLRLRPIVRLCVSMCLSVCVCVLFALDLRRRH